MPSQNTDLYKRMVLEVDTRGAEQVEDLTSKYNHLEEAITRVTEVMTAQVELFEQRVIGAMDRLGSSIQGQVDQLNQGRGYGGGGAQFLPPEQAAQAGIGAPPPPLRASGGFGNPVMDADDALAQIAGRYDPLFAASRAAASGDLGQTEAAREHIHEHLQNAVRALRDYTSALAQATGDVENVTSQTMADLRLRQSIAASEIRTAASEVSLVDKLTPGGIRRLADSTDPQEMNAYRDQIRVMLHGLRQELAGANRERAALQGEVAGGAGGGGDDEGDEGGGGGGGGFFRRAGRFGARFATGAAGAVAGGFGLSFGWMGLQFLADSISTFINLNSRQAETGAMVGERDWQLNSGMAYTRAQTMEQERAFAQVTDNVLNTTRIAQVYGRALGVDPASLTGAAGIERLGGLGAGRALDITELYYEGVSPGRSARGRFAEFLQMQQMMTGALAGFQVNPDVGFGAAYMNEVMDSTRAFGGQRAVDAMSGTRGFEMVAGPLLQAATNPQSQLIRAMMFQSMGGGEGGLMPWEFEEKMKSPGAVGRFLRLGQQFTEGTGMPAWASLMYMMRESGQDVSPEMAKIIAGMNPDDLDKMTTDQTMNAARERMGGRAQGGIGLGHTIALDVETGKLAAGTAVVTEGLHGLQLLLEGKVKEGLTELWEGAKGVGLALKNMLHDVGTHAGALPGDGSGGEGGEGEDGETTQSGMGPWGAIVGGGAGAYVARKVMKFISARRAAAQSAERDRQLAAALKQISDQKSAPVSGAAESVPRGPVRSSIITPEEAMRSPYRGLFDAQGNPISVTEAESLAGEFGGTPTRAGGQAAIALEDEAAASRLASRVGGSVMRAAGKFLVVLGAAGAGWEAYEDFTAGDTYRGALDIAEGASIVGSLASGTAGMAFGTSIMAAKSVYDDPSKLAWMTAPPTAASGAVRRHLTPRQPNDPDYNASDYRPTDKKEPSPSPADMMSTLAGWFDAPATKMDSASSKFDSAVSKFGDIIAQKALERATSGGNHQ